MVQVNGCVATSWLRQQLTFRKWQDYLVICFLIYLAGYFLAPTPEFQRRWFYYTVTIIATFMLLFKGKAIFASDEQGGLKWVLLITLLLFLPFLWTPDADYLKTVRVGAERWLFVFSFALAVFYCARRPALLEKWLPRLLILSGSLGLFLLLYQGLATSRFGNLTGLLILSGNPNSAGVPLGAASVLAASLWLSGRLSWKRNLLWGSLLLLFAVGVVATTARSAELGMLAAGSFLMAKKLRCWWILILPVVGVVLVVLYVVQHTTDPVHYMLSGRLPIWEHIWEVFKANPWFGQGAQDTYAVIIWHGSKLEAHSLYFALAYYAGIFGLLVFALLAWRLSMGARQASSQIQWMYLPLLVYGMTVQLFEGIYPLYRPHLFWLITWLPVLVLMLAPKAEKKSLKEVLV